LVIDVEEVSMPASYVSDPSLIDFPPLDPARTAVVVIDMVNHQLTPGQGMLRMVAENGHDTDYYRERCERLVIPNLKRLLPAVRAAGATVAYVRGASFRSDCSDAIPTIQAVRSSWGAVEGEWASEVIEALRPEPGDINLPKPASGAFSANLDRPLRSLGIEHLLYTGVATNRCVLCSVTAGFDLGYRGYLVADAAAASSAYFEQATVDLISVYMARVVTTDAIIAAIGAGARVPSTA